MLRRPVVVRRGPGLLGTVARTAVIAGTATATSNAITGRQQRKHDEAVAAQEAAAQQQQLAAAASASAPPVASQTAALAPASATPAAPGATPAKAAVGGVVGELQKLAALKESGVLTEAEFSAAKAKLLG